MSTMVARRNREQKWGIAPLRSPTEKSKNKNLGHYASCRSGRKPNGRAGILRFALSRAALKSGSPLFPE